MIPRNIIQTGVNEYAVRQFRESFKRLNPNYSYLFFNDAQAKAFVRKHMSSDIIQAYEIMPMAVLKADYFRYISIYVLGGVYSDIDTECLRPIDKWTDNYTNVSFIVGVEADSPIWKGKFARPLQLCQWTFAAKPKHPILKRVIDIIAKQTKAFLNITLSSPVVMEWTGPGLWTDTVFNYINETYHVEWPTLTKLQHGRLIGDIYLLPISGFSPSVYQNSADDEMDPEARVWHHFFGSWRRKLR